MKKIKVIKIKTENDYKESLSMLEELMLLNPVTGSEEADQLNLLSTLIENYEKNHFSSLIPHPLEAVTLFLCGNAPG